MRHQEAIDALCTAVEDALSSSLNATLVRGEDGTIQVQADADGAALVKAVIAAGWRPPIGAEEKACQQIAQAAYDYYATTVYEGDDGDAAWLVLCNAIEHWRTVSQDTGEQA